MNRPQYWFEFMLVTTDSTEQSLLSKCTLILLALTILSGCRERTESVSLRQADNRSTSEAAVRADSNVPSRAATATPIEKDGTSGLNYSYEGIAFEDVSERQGVRFAYDNGAKGRMLFHEPFGGGHGWLDFDLDGRVDLYLVQGGDGTAVSTSSQPNDQLRRNVGNQFIDVTSNAKIIAKDYGQGVAIADFDNDGFDDIYITNLGPNLLFQNQGDGTFLEVGAKCKVACPSWSTSAAWVDVDLDGNLDLYVCNYVKYDPKLAKSCLDKNGNPVVCNPLSFEPEPDVFYKNDGEGCFDEVAQECGLFGPNNRALGIVSADFDQDGWPDLYVANDASNNFLFHNLQDGHFEEIAVEQGCATDRRGAPQASMGLAVNDYNGDCTLDIYSTHFQSESNTLYRNLGQSGFIDVTGSEGLHTPTIDKLGFGTVMQDLNQDGCMDLFVANGHIDNSGENPNERMEPQLFTYRNGRWFEISSLSGEWFQRKLISRGATFTDFDLDGRIDFAVSNQNEPMSLLRNISNAQRTIWLKLVGVRSNRNGLGAKVVLESQQRRKVIEVVGGGSYASASWYLIPIPEDAISNATTIQVSWPSGLQNVVEIPHYGVLAISTETPAK